MALKKVWLWGLDRQSSRTADRRTAVYEDLLNDSMKNSVTRTVHETLLLRYASEVIHAQGTDSVARLKLIRRISTAYLPTVAVWERVFTLERARDDVADKSVLRAIYEYWRAMDGTAAALSWAGWLIDRGDGKGATQVISSATVQLCAEDKTRLTEAWNARLSGDQTKDEDDGVSEEEELPLTLETS